MHADDNTAGQNFGYFEQCARRSGKKRIAGVDEVGRGPLAGPVVAVAVILPRDVIGKVPLDDSKSLTPAHRRTLNSTLRKCDGIEIGIGKIQPAEIDKINILVATDKAMRSALNQIQPSPEIALVDGLRVPDLPVAAKFIVRGDSRCASIAAASILAKVYRDELMTKLDKEFPGYGFAQNKGYGTPAHIEALNRLGPCPAHRRTFMPVRRAAGEIPTQLELPLSP